ncbi:hypothetical protein M3226_17410 [Neobacillus cucumis]|uniref:hypothetical protein n=1 Tax=Neobacillus cucumis TaxID=1740721 RepID=UPI00203CA647|nr:hypothetical protein [Neobacillus cucumis]MCM3727458.1 hypothetical protein [Neobacillus cucumis]
MKKLLTIIGGLVIAGSLFVTSGNTAKAAEEEPCTCHELIPIQGAERNKIVADFISSNEFKEIKKDLWKLGYSWNGAHTIEVVLPGDGRTMIGVPVISAEGVPDVYVFINGVFVGKESDIPQDQQ